MTAKSGGMPSPDRDTAERKAGPARPAPAAPPGGTSSIYLFSMDDGKKKLAYGRSPEDAIEILRMRLTPEEMERIVLNDFTRIHHADLRKYVGRLG